MSNIINLDVETYVKLLISEKLGYGREDIEKADMGPQKDNPCKKSDRKPQTRQD